MLKIRILPWLRGANNQPVSRKFQCENFKFQKFFAKNIPGGKRQDIEAEVCFRRASVVILSSASTMPIPLPSIRYEKGSEPILKDWPEEQTFGLHACQP
jgi:hypothetical protein